MHRILWVLAAMAALSGCGPIRYEAGNEVNPKLIETLLARGVSKPFELRAILGEPNGQGRAMLPVHDRPQAVWTYYREDGVIDLSGPGTESARTFVFLFFDDEKLDSYLWFSSNKRDPANQSSSPR